MAQSGAGQKEAGHEVLGDEYEHAPVPIAARRSTFSVSMVWLGFPMIITGAMTGSIMVAGMGFQSALLAMLIGNALMFAYVGSLGALGTERGVNFALIASAVFGRKGYVLASGLLSTLLLGWYAVQTGITGNLIHTAFQLNYLTMTVIAGALYLGITFVGIKGLHWIGLFRCRSSCCSAAGWRSTRRVSPAGARSWRIPAPRPTCRWPSASASRS